METPFAPKTHISKRIKLWAVILLVAVILASGLAMLTGGKTRLFKGSFQPIIEGLTPQEIEEMNSLELATKALEFANKIDPTALEAIGLAQTVADTLITQIKTYIENNDIGNAKQKFDEAKEKMSQSYVLIAGAQSAVNSAKDTLTVSKTKYTTESNNPWFDAKVLTESIKKQNEVTSKLETSNPQLAQQKTKIADGYLKPIEEALQKLTPENKQASLTITISVIGGSLKPSNFPFYIPESPNPETPRQTGSKNVLAAGNYTIKIAEQNDYAPTQWTGDCSSDGKIILQGGDDKTCTITATYTPPKINQLFVPTYNPNIKFALPISEPALTLTALPPIGEINKQTTFTLHGENFPASPATGAPTMEYQITFDPNDPTTTITKKFNNPNGNNAIQYTYTKSGTYNITATVIGKSDGVQIGPPAMLQYTINPSQEQQPTPTDIPTDLKPLCLEQANKHPHSAYYTWKDSNKVCVYDGKEYDSLEKLQEAIKNLNEAVLKTTCPNVGGKLTPSGCEFDGNTYTSVDALNAATEGESAILQSGKVLGTAGTVDSSLTLVGNTGSANPKLIFSVPADAPKDGNIEQGKTIETTAFELKAENNPVIITKLRLTHLSPNDTSTTSDIASISIKSSTLLPITISPDSKFPYDYIILPGNLTIPADTSIKFWIEAKVKATAPINNQFKLGFLEKANIIASAVNTSTPVEIVMPALDQTFGGTFTIIAAESSNTPAGAQLTVSKPTTEIAAGNIIQGSSADVLKLKFQASTDADITINSIKITTQGSAPVTDLQSFKLMEGANVIGSSTDIGVNTLIATPSFTILKGAERQLMLNVTAKSSALKDNIYLFKIQQSTDIFADTANVLLNPTPLSSAEFKIATAVAGAGSTPTAPTVSVTASPSNSQVSGQTVTFTIAVTNGSGMYNYSLDLGDGKTVKTLNGATSATATFDNIYTEAKTYTVKASVNMVINGVSQIISAPDLGYTVTAIAVAPPPPAPSQDIVNLQNQLAAMQQQLANSQNAQSTAQIAALNKQIADLIALNAAKEADAKSKSSKTKEKSKTPVETPEMWGPTQTPAQPGSLALPLASVLTTPAPIPQAAMGVPMYGAAPSLGYSQKLIKAPDKSNTGPEVLVYFIAVGAANAAWWIRRKVQK